MKPVYARRARVDLDQILAWYSANASPAMAQAIEQRFNDVIDRICSAPESAPRLSQRPDVRVVAVIRYPFRVFYRIRRDTVDILHIRHTSRRPVAGL